jgi:hypothetical protein
MITAEQFASYEAEVSAELVREYGLTWADACGDVDPLSRALADGLRPADFVSQFAERYGLEPARPRGDEDMLRWPT